LIEQWLKEVEVAPIDQGDANHLPGQRMGCPQARESTANDHHMRGITQQFRGGCQLKKEALWSHETAGAVPKLSMVFEAGFLV
jgi:hypothetical protein